MKGTPGEPCPKCGRLLEDPPLCYGAEAPWRIFGVSESEFSQRVDLTPDQCVVDERYFFIRGHIALPIIGRSESFEWSVWCSLSQRSFLHASERWLVPDRVNDPPYFGWLMSALPSYPDTLHLKASVQSRAVGTVPSVTLEPSDHPLAQDQAAGITMQRVREFAHEILHAHGGGQIEVCQ
jgi:hypothetical protein